MAREIACIVEGHGDIEAIQILVRRIAQRLIPPVEVHLPPPIRIPRSRLLRQGELETAVELAARISRGGALIILLDSDDECPAQLGPSLLARATRARGDIPIAAVLAKREFESWFLAAAESLRGRRGLRQDIRSPLAPETVRGAKEWLRDRMQSEHKYRERLDQPALAAVFDLDQARRADSFDKFYREIVRLLA